MASSRVLRHHLSQSASATDQLQLEPMELSNVQMAPRRERRTHSSQTTQTHGHVRLPTVEPSIQPLQPTEQESSSSKKRRGPSRCRYLEHLSPGETLHVKIVGGDAVGVNSSLFQSFLGKLARMHIPLTTRDFRRDVSQATRATILRALEGSFSWERSQENDRQILCHVADLHRQYRCLMKKKYFDESIPLEELRRRVPTGLSSIIWGKLIDYWTSEEYKRKAKKNGENRANGIHPTHRMGRKNINQKTDEFIKKHSRVPTRVEIFRLTKTREVNGVRIWESTELQKEHDEMVRLMTPSTSESIDGEPAVPLSPDEAFAMVKGPERPGRVRCAGRGATPSTYFGNKGNTSNQEVIKLRDTVETLKEKLCLMEEKMTNMMEMHRQDMERLISVVGKGKESSSHESGGLISNHGHGSNSKDNDYDDDDEYYSDDSMALSDMHC